MSGILFFIFASFEPLIVFYSLKMILGEGTVHMEFFPQEIMLTICIDVDIDPIRPKESIINNYENIHLHLMSKVMASLLLSSKTSLEALHLKTAPLSAAVTVVRFS